MGRLSDCLRKQDADKNQKIASLEENVELLAREVYWLSNRLRELDPEHASQYLTATATPCLTRSGTIKTMGSSSFEFPPREMPETAQADWTPLTRSISVTAPSSPKET